LDLSEARGASGQRHPWEIARVRALGAILRRHGTRAQSILDVGCGDGFVGESVRALLGASLLVGVDVHLPPEACGISPRPGHVIERHASHDAVGTRQFDLVLALDVIEHVNDDRALLAEVIRPRIVPGGLVLVSVPAFQSLFSDHDRALHHYRRYNTAQLRSVLRATGLAILDEGYMFASLLLPRAIGLAGERMGRRRTEHGIGPWRGPVTLTQLLAATLTLDARVLLAAGHVGLRIPGLTAWALCTTR
jgi:SAM-dependent methyltransferase